MAEDAERFKKAAREMSERTTLAMEEALAEIMNTLEALRGGIESACEALREFAEELELLDVEPRARRRKRARTRARYIEQHYRAEIRRCERSRLYRRIYKPP